MANFNGTARSNYFRVKNAAAFEAAMQGLPDIDVWTKTDEAGVVRHAISSVDCDTGAWPSWTIRIEPDPDEEGAFIGDEYEIDMPTEIAPHLMDGEICVLMEAGAEKLRYISGWAVAFDNTERPRVYVSLSDIYAKAKEAFGATPTDASY